MNDLPRNALIVRPVGEVNRNFLYLLSLFAVASTILVANLLVAPPRFADYSTYLLYLDELAYYRARDWYQFEPLSKSLLLALRWVARSTDGAIDLAHWLLGGTYVVMTALMMRRERATWQSVALTFAILGPVLAFVTIRATPAYFLVAIAALAASRRERRFVPLLAVALLFHVSAVFAVVPLVLAYYQHRLPAILSPARRKSFLVFAVLLALAFVLTGSLLVDAIENVVRGFSYLGKYTVYLGSLDQVPGPVVETSVFHYFFLAFATGFVGAFIMIADDRSRQLFIYVASSYLIYLFSFFLLSPVAAFRQTPFWMLPALVVFPWRRLGPGGLTGPILLAFSALAFGLQLDSVFQ